MQETKYPKSQANLYQTIRIILQNALKYIVSFTNYRAVYDAAYINSLQTECDDAEAMADDAARTLTHESLRVDVADTAKTCLALWQSLKNYISHSLTDKSKWGMNWGAAGWGYYESGAGNNWESVRQLMNSGNQYITDHLTALKAGDNMPDDFQDDFTAAQTAFTTAVDSFYQAEEDARVGTDAKITANNAIYEKVMDNICADGSRIFADDEEKARQFSYQSVSELVTPIGAGTLKVDIDNAANNLPIANAEVMIVERNETRAASDDGRVEFGNLARGNTYTLRITAPNFEEQQMQVVIPETSNSKDVSVEMQPVNEPT